MVNTTEFKKALLDAGLTQRGLAELSGIPKNTLNRKINGHSDITTEEISAICKCLKITDPVRKCAIFLS